MAAVFFIAAAHFYLKWRDADAAILMVLVSVMLATTSYFRRRALNRKTAAFKEAVKRYENMLGEPPF